MRVERARRTVREEWIPFSTLSISLCAEPRDAGTHAHACASVAPPAFYLDARVIIYICKRMHPKGPQCVNPKKLSYDPLPCDHEPLTCLSLSPAPALALSEISWLSSHFSSGSRKSLLFAACPKSKLYTAAVAVGSEKVVVYRSPEPWRQYCCLYAVGERQTDIVRRKDRAHVVPSLPPVVAVLHLPHGEKRTILWKSKIVLLSLSKMRKAGTIVNMYVVRGNSEALSATLNRCEREIGDRLTLSA